MCNEGRDEDISGACGGLWGGIEVFVREGEICKFGVMVVIWGHGEWKVTEGDNRDTPIK
jgi:hypothetical protein